MLWTGRWPTRFPKTTYNVTILRGKQHTPAPRDATDVFDQYGDADQWGSHSLAVRISAGQCAGRNFGTTNTPSEPSRPGLETRRREADEPGRARVCGGGVCNEHMDTNQEHYPDQEDGRLVLGRFQFRAWECFLFVFDGISTILNSMFSLLSSAHLYIAQTRFHVNPPLPPYSLPASAAPSPTVAAHASSSRA